MRQEATRVTLSTTPVSAFAPTTIQCGNQTCSVRVEVSSQFFNVTSGNIVRIHVKSDGNPFPSTGFDVDGGINRPVATLSTAAHLKTGLSPGSHSVTVEFDMRSPARHSRGRDTHRDDPGIYSVVVSLGSRVEPLGDSRAVGKSEELQLGHVPEPLDLAQPACQWVPTRENLAHHFLSLPRVSRT